jgi:hypothetical protein
MTDSAVDRQRVAQAITWAIVEFFQQRLDSMHHQFHADDLRRFVRAKVGDTTAPASPDRIMRALKQGGRINYTLLSRSKSLYRAEPMPMRPAPASTPSDI